MLTTLLSCVGQGERRASTSGLAPSHPPDAERYIESHYPSLLWHIIRYFTFLINKARIYKSVQKTPQTVYIFSIPIGLTFLYHHKL